MSIWNSWAISYRNARGIAAALALLLAIVSLLSLRCNPMVGRDRVLGLVLEIEAEGLHPLNEGAPQSRVLVATPDSSTIRLFLPPPVPRPGDFIPLTAERFKDGRIDYFLDQQQWRIDGPT